MWFLLLFCSLTIGRFFDLFYLFSTLRILAFKDVREENIRLTKFKFLNTCLFVVLGCLEIREDLVQAQEQISESLSVIKLCPAMGKNTHASVYTVAGRCGRQGVDIRNVNFYKSLFEPNWWHIPENKISNAPYNFFLTHELFRNVFLFPDIFDFSNFLLFYNLTLLCLKDIRA